MILDFHDFISLAGLGLHGPASGYNESNKVPL